ncbi:methylglutamate dehydrogenase [Phormidium sp. FACHB-592]|uniref:Methylglutamate dehydrogenase n=1 Tax=Stenomitos frigidus AS-A4 TaxID=2933935 RepID=A0ABV0KRA0_9CYAN|nr:methylglutamate dehydrogenase [Phormidium sp. FACHB-592]MBD2076735.1 methylglutamate dehydrogenase [Phormidium sp. FACHB-592]
MIRFSPMHDRLQSIDGSWRNLNGMPSLVAVLEEAVIGTLDIADVSCLTRFGVKGTNAADWLSSQGITTPDRPNTWNPLPDGGIIARFGLTEFFIEDSLQNRLAVNLAAACQQPPAKVYPVLRQDAAIVLCGSAVNELLLQTCSVNFRALSLLERPVILTSMVGVAVTIIPGDRNGQPFYRLWCDGTFGAYLWQTLSEVVAEMGGVVVGVEEGMKG